MTRKILFVFALALIGLGVYLLLKQEKVTNEYLVLYGNVDVRQVDLGFRVAGRVETLFFEEGDLVSQGAILANLDRAPYGDRVLEANASLESVKAALVNAEKNFQRRQELVGDGSVSKEDLDNAKTTLKQQQAAINQAKASLDIAKSNLEFTEIFAPTEGIILSRIREPGTVVNPADPVYTLSITSPVWIRAFCSEPELGLIYPGMKAEIFTDTPGVKPLTGTVGFISPIAEFTPKSVETTQLRTDLVYRLRIYVDNPDGFLRQGMPVTVKLDTSRQVNEPALAQ